MRKGSVGVFAGRAPSQVNMYREPLSIAFLKSVEWGESCGSGKKKYTDFQFRSYAPVYPQALVLND